MLKSLFCSVIAFGFALTPAKASPSLDLYGRLPAVEDLTLSPDGQDFAYVMTENSARYLIVRAVSGEVLERVTIDQWKPRYIRWAGNDRIIIFISNTVRLGAYQHNALFRFNAFERLSAASINIRTHKLFKLSYDHGAWSNPIFRYFGSAEINGRWVGLFEGQNSRSEMWGSGLGLFQVDLDSGAATEVAVVDRSAEDWLFNNGAQMAARAKFDPLTGNWSLLAGEQGHQLLISRQSTTSDLRIAGFGRTKDSILVNDQTGDEDKAYEVSSDGSGKTQTLFEGLTTTEELYGPDDRLLIGALDTQKGTARLFDPLYQKRYEAAVAPFAKFHPTLVSYDAAFDRLIILTNGGDDSGTYWLVDLNTGKASSLAQAYTAIGPADVGPSSLVRYEASDGLEIEAVLTLPPGRLAAHLPLVVMPHGGPIGVGDGLGFDWWAQAFASRGYAVLRPNYRGSGGYGAPFRRSGYGEWGRKMQTDLSDGVAYLAGRGVVDPKRVCIVGASYGGYAALAGVTLQHGVYRCAVSYGGLSDLAATLFRASGNNNQNVEGRWITRAIGASWSGDASLKTRSPVYQAAEADAPILLIHGQDDGVVPISESQRMDEALSAAGKAHKFLPITGEDHWLSSSATRTQVLQASVDFVMEHDPPG